MYLPGETSLRDTTHCYAWTRATLRFPLARQALATIFFMVVYKITPLRTGWEPHWMTNSTYQSPMLDTNFLKHSSKFSASFPKAQFSPLLCFII